MFRSLRLRLLASYLLIIFSFIATLLGVLSATSLSDRSLSAQVGSDLLLVVNPVSSLIRQATRENINNPPELRSALDEIANDSDLRLILVRSEDFQILYDSEGAWDNTKMETSLSRDLRITDRLGRFTNNETGKTWIFYSPPLNDNQRTFFVLGNEQPQRGEYFVKTILEPLGRGTLIALGLAVILAFWVARSIVRPLQKLNVAVQSLASGDFNKPVRPNGPNEVRQLAASFNQMAQQVQQTRQAQRDLVANVSHDLKTPITSIQGWSQAMLDGTIDDDGMRKQSAEIIHNEASRMSRMVNELLELARLDAGEINLNKSTVDLVDLLYAVRDNLRPQAERNSVRLQLEMLSVPAIQADGDRVMQIVTNLADNAVAHTPPDGTVTLKLYSDNGMAVIAVEDTGQGIAEGEIGRIFERFYQVDKSRRRSTRHRGTGLGLAISRDIAIAHNGTLAATSQVGTGTTFTLRLPLS